MQQRNKLKQSRIGSIQKKLDDFNTDCLIFFNISNIRYFSGFTGSDGILIIDSNDATLLVDGRYATQAKLETKNIQICEYTDKLAGIVNIVKTSGAKYIGFEALTLTVYLYNELKKLLSEMVLVPLGDELKLIRACKDKNEIALMKKAAEISSAAIHALIGEIKAGVTERDLTLELEFQARRSGAEQIAFETIIAFGENAALPHARPGMRKLKKGDFIIVDFGVKYAGYCSDETCTFAFGELTDEQTNCYQIVKNAQDRALSEVRANITGDEIDSVARNCFEKKYQKYFVHGTGHGVGLEVHEAPRLTPNSQDVLMSQMIVTIEPGLYIPGHWGIRIEDTVVVKENSCEKLTKMDKGLIIIQ